MENLKLRRPLALVDLESTGTLPSSDRIVEIAILRVNPDGGEDFRCKRVNPGVPIPAEATAIHGITDADVASEPAFAAYARSLSDFLTDCDIAGFNVARFDLPMLEAEFRRAGVTFSREGRAVIDAMAIFHQKERRDLAAAVRFYCGRDFPEAHSSEDDVRATADVLRAQLERYDDLPRDVEALDELLNRVDPSWIDPDGKFRWTDGTTVIAFGQHKGRTLQDLAAEEPDYLEWMVGQDFSPEVMEIVRDALSGRFPTPP
jgi:DNA polymerase-3 subunit epsilon